MSDWVFRHESMASSSGAWKRVPTSVPVVAERRLGFGFSRVCRVFMLTRYHGQGLSFYRKLAVAQSCRSRRCSGHWSCACSSRIRVRRDVGRANLARPDQKRAHLTGAPHAHGEGDASFVRRGRCNPELEASTAAPAEALHTQTRGRLSRSLAP